MIPQENIGRFLDTSSFSDEVKSKLRDKAASSEAIVPRGDGNTDPLMATMREVAIDERASPLFFKDDAKLAKLAPVLVQVCEFDPLRDEALLYYNRLKSLGVDATLSYLENATHAEPLAVDLMRLPPTKAMLKGVEDAVAFMKKYYS